VWIEVGQSAMASQHMGMQRAARLALTRAAPQGTPHLPPAGLEDALYYAALSDSKTPGSGAVIITAGARRALRSARAPAPRSQTLLYTGRRDPHTAPPSTAQARLCAAIAPEPPRSSRAAGACLTRRAPRQATARHSRSCCRGCCAG